MRKTDFFFLLFFSPETKKPQGYPCACAFRRLTFMFSRHFRLTQPPPPSRSSRMRVVVVVAPRRPHLAVNHRHADRPHLTDAHHHRATRYTSGLIVLNVFQCFGGCYTRIRDSTATGTKGRIKTRRRTGRLLAMPGSSFISRLLRFVFFLKTDWFQKKKNDSKK